MRERKNASVPGVLDLVAAPSAPQRHSQRSIHLFRDGNVAALTVPDGGRHVNQFGTGQLAPVPPSSSARATTISLPRHNQVFPQTFFRGGVVIRPKVRPSERDFRLQATIIGRDANKASRSGLAPVRYE